jgi:hypothetical protein
MPDCYLEISKKSNRSEQAIETVNRVDRPPRMAHEGPLRKGGPHSNRAARGNMHPPRVARPPKEFNLRTMIDARSSFKYPG